MPGNSRLLMRCCLAGIVFGAAFAYPAIAAGEQKVALVIGNSAYPVATLTNPVNDATAVAAKLRSMGFDVTLKTNAIQRDMTRSFREFGQKLAKGSVGLFYFAGYGIQAYGKNFLIPVDAEIDTEASAQSEGVDVDHVIQHMGSARLSMVILDASRSSPFEQRFRSGGGNGLAQISAPTGSLLAYAAAPGKVVPDAGRRLSIYATELLKVLNIPGLAVEDVFKQLRINVLQASNNAQVTWDASSLTGKFYFWPGSNALTVDEQLLQEEQARIKLQQEIETLRVELLKRGIGPAREESPR